MFCQNCGKEIEAGVAFCKECGARVLDDSADVTNLPKIIITVKEPWWENHGVLMYLVFRLATPLLFMAMLVLLLLLIPFIICAMIFSLINAKKYKAEKLAIGNIDMTLLNCYNHIVDNVNIYNIDFLFDNKNPDGNSISLSKFMKYNILGATGERHVSVSLKNKECKTAYLSRGKTIVTFNIFLKKSEVIKHLYNNKKIIIDFSNNGGTPVQGRYL